jgi:hypothetical protein
MCERLSKTLVFNWPCRREALRQQWLRHLSRHTRVLVLLDTESRNTRQLHHALGWFSKQCLCSWSPLHLGSNHAWTSYMLTMMLVCTYDKRWLEVCGFCVRKESSSPVWYQQNNLVYLFLPYNNLSVWDFSWVLLAF